MIKKNLLIAPLLALLLPSIGLANNKYHDYPRINTDQCMSCDGVFFYGKIQQGESHLSQDENPALVADLASLITVSIESALSENESLAFAGATEKYRKSIINAMDRFSAGGTPIINEHSVVSTQILSIEDDMTYKDSHFLRVVATIEIASPFGHENFELKSVIEKKGSSFMLNNAKLDKKT